MSWQGTDKGFKGPLMVSTRVQQGVLAGFVNGFAQVRRVCGVVRCGARVIYMNHMALASR